MSYRPSPKYASKDARRGPWTTCPQCGLIWNLCDMQFQFDFQGGVAPINTNLLRCPKCITPLTWQRQLIVIPPDPPPIFNTRPEPYTVDETNWLTTQDYDIFETVDGSEEYITSMPNPATAGNTSYLTASITYSGGSTTTLYLDLFLGNPASGGVSVLSTITGSSTRTNIGSSMGTPTNNIAINTTSITVASSCAGNTNVNFIGFYDAATNGTLLASGRVSATAPFTTEGVAVVIDSTGLTIDLN